MKIAMIPTGILVSFLFLFSLGLYLAVPFFLALLIALFLIIPSVLPLFADHMKRGKLRTVVARLSEAVTAAYLYLLIVLLFDSLLLILLHFLGIPVFLPLVFALSAGVYAAALIAGILHAKRISVRRYELRFPGEGLRRGRTRAVFFSDLHLGFFTTKALLERLKNTVREQKPDLLLMAGDLFDSDYSELKHEKEAIELFSSLPCPDGRYACPGNHDAFTEDDPRLGTFLRAGGITVLRDEKVSLPYFDLYGRKDADDDRKDARSVCASSHRPLIVLDHRPKEPEALIENGARLVLSGHTHNGQTFPGNVLNAVTGKYNYGLKKYKNGFNITTSGAGYCGLPIRLFTSNEIVVLDLVFD